MTMMQSNTPESSNMSRRRFVAAGAVLPVLLASGVETSPRRSPRSSFLPVDRIPDRVLLVDGEAITSLAGGDSGWGDGGVRVEITQALAGLDVRLRAPGRPVSRICLRWKVEVSPELRFLGDHWERAYGDLEWRSLVPERVMPWYFLTYDGDCTHGYGIETAPGAFAFWRVDSAGVSLWLDVRNGGSPVQLGDRMLAACTILTRKGDAGEVPWNAARVFCRQMCPAPRLPAQPVYGGNNWYYAYGKNCTARAIEEDSRLLADLTDGIGNRPYQVIDDGWQVAGGNCSGGPWNSGNGGFPDMPGLAASLKATGVRPGIWMRPLLTWERGLDSCALKRPTKPEFGLTLDPTIPEIREKIRHDVAGIIAWGYEMLKHDFTTYDLLGRWGPQLRGSLTDEGWAFADRTRTTAEIILDLYRTIRAAAGPSALIIGCNTVGHLSAGLFELQRGGDDTSGQTWDKTRRMGVNTLAFRGPQHGTFFSVDADCVAFIPDRIPWSLNSQWLDLVSRSGTPLFISAAASTVNATRRKELQAALRRAAAVQPLAMPLDWLATTTPQQWCCGVETVSYDWFQQDGIVEPDPR